MDPTRGWHLLRLNLGGAPSNVPEGPYSDEEIKTRLRDGRCLWWDMARTMGKPWARLCDIDVFRSIFPETPTLEHLEHLEAMIQSWSASPKIIPGRMRSAGQSVAVSEEETATEVVVPITERPAEFQASAPAAPTTPTAAAVHVPPPPAGAVQAASPAGPAIAVPPAPAGAAHTPPQAEAIAPAPEEELAPKYALWFLQFGGTEFGPFTLAELQHVLETKKIQGDLYAWRQGLENWTPVEGVKELAHLFKDSPTSAKKKKHYHRDSLALEPQRNQRAGMRRPLIATVTWVQSPKSKPIIGVCADVSITGVQVILDGDFQFQVGDVYEFEIHPIGKSGLPSFFFSAKAVWMDAPTDRVGFLFTDIQPVSQKTLEKYLEKMLTGTVK